MTGFDISLFIFLLVTFIYVFTFNVITTQHKVYLLFHFFMMFWPICQVGVHTTDNPNLQIIFINTSFVCLSMLGFGWLLFTKFLVNAAYRPSRKFLAYMVLPSLIMSVFVVWNPAELFMRPVDGSYTERIYGPIFWVLAALLISYYVISVRMLLGTYRLRKAQQEDRVSIVNALIGIIILVSLSLLDMVVNVVLDPWLPVIPGLTSLGIVTSNLYFVFALQRNRTLDLVKIAHQDVVDTLSVGVIVLDEHDQVIEMNRIMSPFFRIRVGEKLNMAKLLAGYSTDAASEESFLHMYQHQPSKRIQTEIVIEHDKLQTKFFSLHVAPVIVGGRRIGRVITFQDITELKSLILKSQEHNSSLQERNRALIYMQDELFQANRKLEQMAITDSLTGCFNRRYLMQQLEHEVLTNLRYKIPFALILFDIDLFKQVNDTYGHIVGDEVIRRTAEAVRSSLRRTDILARYGGEEFTLYMPHTTREHAEMLAQRVREAVEGNFIQLGRGRSPISVTVSMGMIAVEEPFHQQYDDIKEYLKELFLKADSALYRAKDDGRNRVVNL
ncbi:diguanylate cyclase (GGDEF)-like protein [Paenibacillus taihuensis]|uniref:Diguanylate cyclase (GGDEF)-like protein n=1 Tax=Paenibacillus taihuensis TaxID=1156355 RepID=A0A3D9SHQ7_9BACL|nr:diguanylate cyclase [Paenibacillus taihuensis]REE92810.1 diguanylate cyclase (GGDEF)-like protein [Paenibacillus taihuensis]